MKAAAVLVVLAAVCTAYFGSGAASQGAGTIQSRTAALEAASK
ncbi:hypothetical protein [Caenimonas sedimenti]|nr:hypothetical protein [Caenimonas sedimenti]